MNILLLAGGWSPEREVSLQSAEMMISAMKEYGHTVTCLDPLYDFKHIIDVAKKHDVAFILLHGSPGEDGLFQALLERAGCPYQGANPSGSILALHKAAAKILFCDAGLLTPKSIFLPLHPGPNWIHDLTYPLFVKANTGGSSVNVTFVNDSKELFLAVEALFAAGEEVLIEEAILGQEVTCGVIDDEVLPPILIRSKGQFFDYYNKYTMEGAEEICPAPLPEHIIKNIQNYAIRAHNALNLWGCSRADLMLRDDGELFILEVNTIPGMCATSLVPREAAVMGITYPMLVEKLLQLAIRDHRKIKSD